MPTAPLGKLEKSDLRSVFISEPGDFMPWLAQEANLAQLAEGLGIDELELDDIEKYVGPFRADILCSGSTRASAIEWSGFTPSSDHGLSSSIRRRGCPSPRPLLSRSQTEH